MIEPESYCRELEAYLCRKNDGHLVRISGPAFDQVSRWAHEGIPIKVAYEGIDRYFERYYRKGPRRRPVRIEFCEADVLDVFDAWRRAVGVRREDDAPVRPRSSLAAHIERVIARLTALRASSQATQPFEALLERIARELDALQPQAKGARGAAREALLTQLATLDRTLLGTVLEAADDATRAAADASTKEQLAPFRDRMTSEAYQRACTAAKEHYVRDHFGLPTIAFD
jgi:hypothetical protein